MNRVFVLLVLGIFLMTGVCMAADNKAPLDAIANPALRAQVEATVKAVPDQNTNAITKALNALKEGKSEYDQKLIDTVINSLHRNWVGVDYDAELVAKVALAAKGVAPSANPITTENLMAITDEMGATAKIPPVKVLPQADMQGIIGPIFLAAEGVIVVGDSDHKAMKALQSRCAHEIAEAVGLGIGLSKEDAHAKAEKIEAGIRTKGVASRIEAERVAEMSINDAERMWDTLKVLPEGAKVNIKVKADLKGRPDLEAGFRVLSSRLGAANIDVKYSLPADGSLGTFAVEVLDKNNAAVNQCTVVAKGTLCRINGLLNEGLMAASIPAIAQGENPAAYQAKCQPALNLLMEQHKANTNGQVLAIPADPNEWPKVLRRIELELPQPQALGISDLQQEQKIAQDTFGKMA